MSTRTTSRASCRLYCTNADGRWFSLALATGVDLSVVGVFVLAIFLSNISHVDAELPFLFSNLDNLHPDNVFGRNHFFNLLHSSLRESGDVQQSILILGAIAQSDETSKGLDRHNSAFVDGMQWRELASCRSYARPSLLATSFSILSSFSTALSSRSLPVRLSRRASIDGRQVIITEHDMHSASCLLAQASYKGILIRHGLP
mmetsp:Transcript_73358/g.174757  ORF Transcript_73358/g.174757 Transcript_73358/m.174757 type:complete len:202 (+) Transcript_73358:546-1151(+)